MSDQSLELQQAALVRLTMCKRIKDGVGHPRLGDGNRRQGLKTINVAAKKADYYKQRLPEELHGNIVAEGKAMPRWMPTKTR